MSREIDDLLTRGEEFAAKDDLRGACVSSKRRSGGRVRPEAFLPEPYRGLGPPRLLSAKPCGSSSRRASHLPTEADRARLLLVARRNETREWREGELHIFDHTIEHEPRNPSGEMRIVPHLRHLRPELSEAERNGVSAIFHAIDRFSSMQLPGGIDG